MLICAVLNTLNHKLGAEIRNDAYRERNFEFVGDCLLDSFPSDHHRTAVILFEKVCKTP